MKNYAMHLFRLGNRLANALSGDKQALADLQKLYRHHPEMFADLKDLINTIETVAQNPEIIVDATHSNKDTGIFKAAKRLDNQKMGDIVVKNKNGTNEIFHANKKKIKEFGRLYRQVKAGGRCAHFLHPDLENQLGLVQKAHSPANLTSLAETPTPSTHQQLLEQKPTGELIAQKDELSGANALSSTAKNNSTTIPNASQSKPKIRRRK